MRNWPSITPPLVDNYPARLSPEYLSVAADVPLFAEWMDVAFGPGHLTGREIANFDVPGGAQASPSSRAQFGVSRPVDEEGQPADLELEPDVDEQVGLAQARHVAGLGLEVVRVLVPAAQRLDFDVLAADEPDEGSQVGRRGHHANLRVGDRGDDRQEDGQEQGGSHDSS